MGFTQRPLFYLYALPYWASYYGQLTPGHWEKLLMASNSLPSCRKARLYPKKFQRLNRWNSSKLPPVSPKRLTTQHPLRVSRSPLPDPFTYRAQPLIVIARQTALPPPFGMKRVPRRLLARKRWRRSFSTGSGIQSSPKPSAASSFRGRSGAQGVNSPSLATAQ